MVSVGVPSHQGRAYGPQPEPHPLLHSSGAAGLLSRPLGPRHRAFCRQDASGRWKRLVWVELGVWLTIKAHGLRSEEVVHARNVIAFFVWAWPSGFCD